MTRQEIADMLLGAGFNESSSLDSGLGGFRIAPNPAQNTLTVRYDSAYSADELLQIGHKLADYAAALQARGLAVRNKGTHLIVSDPS